MSQIQENPEQVLTEGAILIFVGNNWMVIMGVLLWIGGNLAFSMLINKCAYHHSTSQHT